MSPGQDPGLEPGVIDELMAVARDAATAAAGLIRAATGDQDDRPAVASTKSSPTDVVTAMDRAIERHLREHLAKVRPQDGVLGEEEDGLRAGSSGLTWVLDPIDGTVNYLYRIPVYSVSVAVVAGDPRVPGAWTPVAGCVVSVETGETWTAGLGRGSAVDGRPLSIRTDPDGPRELSQALVATGFGYRAERRAEQARVFAALAPVIRDIRRIGSASLDLCMVAAGQVDLYYERGVNVWDMAAAALVVIEAGGVVTGLAGRPLGERTVLAGEPGLCARLAEALVAAGADDFAEDREAARGG